MGLSLQPHCYSQSREGEPRSLGTKIGGSVELVSSVIVDSVSPHSTDLSAAKDEPVTPRKSVR